MIPLALLSALSILAVTAYVAMFDLKPRIARPVMADDDRARVDVLQERLMRHVRVLAGEIGERNVFNPRALEAAAAYIGQVWAAQGLSVREEPFVVRGQRCANLAVELPGSPHAPEVVVVGAHYDSVLGSPGADDNATGVAVLLEMARALTGAPLARRLRLVAFVNEEPPFFQTEAMGSRRHARQARARGEAIVAMLSLESLGAYSDAPGSQRYPFPLGFLYPRTGNFLGVVGDLRSRSLVKEVVGHLMATSDVPVEAAATFSWLPGVDWSDHWSFWREGYRAVMLTDTALFRHAPYHGPEDRADAVNAPEFARAAHGIIRTVGRLAGSS